MANFSTLFPLIIMASILLSSHSALSLSASPSSSSNTIAASPSILPDEPPLSPDVAPLLPSPRTRSSSMPTIPSTRTTNPDEAPSVDPDLAFAPSGLMPVSSAMELHHRGFSSLISFLVSLWFIQAVFV